MMKNNDEELVRKIKCSTGEGEIIETPWHLMMQSRTFKDMWKSSLSLDKSFDHLKNAEKFIFPLNDITKICFGKIVEWLDNHDGQPDPVIEEDPITTERVWFKFTDWECDFFNGLNFEMLKELFLAADYLDIPSLYFYCAQSSAEQIMNKSPEEIRQMLSLPDDARIYIVEVEDLNHNLSIIYASFTVLNFIAPPIIKFLGTRTSLALAGLAYVLFLAGFLHLHQWFLYSTSALLGLGAAIIWTAQGKYLTRNSTEKTAGKHSSLFLALNQACLTCGGIFLLIIFLSTSSSDQNSNFNSVNSSSSASFPPSTIFIIYSSFTGIALFGVLILAFLPSTKRQLEGESAKTKGGEIKFLKESNLEQIKSIFKVAATPKMAALAFSFAYSGILLSFWSSIFPTAILNTVQFQAQFSPKILIALNSIVKGLGQPLLSLFFHWFHLHRIRRSRLVLVGVLINLTTFALCFINLPNISPLGRTEEEALIRPSAWIALLCGFLLSFGDACWNTQLFSFLIANYPNKSAEAFALLKFYQSLLTSILFYISAHLLLHWHLIILLISAILGYFGFMIAEILEEKRPCEIRVQNE